jgi:outer membrane protein OmpA-like peptidoglycan-associated protein
MSELNLPPDATESSAKLDDSETRANPNQGFLGQHLSPGSLDELRQLLFGREQAELKRLRGAVDRAPSAESLARSLPDAIKVSRSNGAALDFALTPTIESALRASVKKDPKPLLDVLFPLLGPAIRKAIQSALDGMLAGLNSATENSLNPWMRIRAWRSGLPFGEYVLLQSLVFRVEQVIWIHNDTGMLLQDVAAPHLGDRSPDLVASMITALQSFARDSFALSEADHLDQFRLGDLTVLATFGRRTCLLVAVRGNPPAELGLQMNECLENIEFRNGPELDVFEGDSGPFSASRDQLEQLVQLERTPVSAQPSLATKLILAGIALSILLLGGLWALDIYRIRNLIENIEKVPGYSVSRYERGWLGGGEIWGLRDPLSSDLDVVFGGLWMNPKSYPTHWKPYYSVEPSIVNQRIRQNLKAPKTVKVVFQDGVLMVSGQASDRFISQSRVLANSLPGVDQYRDNGLEDIDPANRLRKHIDLPATAQLDYKAGLVTISGSANHGWIVATKKTLSSHEGVSKFNLEAVEDLDLVVYERLVKSIESKSVYFEGGRATMLSGGDGVLNEVGDLWRQLKVKATLLDKRVQIVATGQSDKPGSRELNLKLCRERGEVTKALLLKLGMVSEEISVDAIISNTEDPRLRRVIFLIKDKS